MGGLVAHLVETGTTGNGGNDHGLFWHTDIYERHNRRWQAVWSQATRIAERT
jgi:hypothetical protein